MRNPKNSHIDLRHTMYPCEAFLLDGHRMTMTICERYATFYGYAMHAHRPTIREPAGSITTVLATEREPIPRVLLNCGDYFCLPNTAGSVHIELANADIIVLVIIRYGFLGQQLVGGPLERKGRLTYIDGCSDSLLVYPPRRGDPSLNHLHFPRYIKQTRHTHPSIRVGIVASGIGSAVTDDGEHALQPGTLWCIDEMEQHYFQTADAELDVIAFHPDGDWGPEDHNHQMLNRTYIEGSRDASRSGA